MKEDYLKRLQNVWFQISAMWYPGKGKTCRQWKDHWLLGSGGTERWASGEQRILEQWDLSVWYHNGGYMSLDTYPNPQNVQHTKWTLIWTLDYAW